MARIVVTGGPGCGKTTLLVALQERGHTIVGDSPRLIIQDRLRRGIPPRPSQQEFAQEILRLDMENYARHEATPGPVFFERGILDALGMLDDVSPLSEPELDRWVAAYPYFPKVFVLPPWREIYRNDSERDHSYEHAERVHVAIREWYRRCGYQLIELPKAPVDERCAQLLQEVAKGAAQRMKARPAEESEIAWMADLWFAGWQDAHARIVPAELARHRTLESFASRLRTALARVRVVGPAGRPLGFSVIDQDELNQLYVSAPARRTAVAGALLADAEFQLRAAGVKTAWLACAIGNERAARFYEKHGWVRVGHVVIRLETPDGLFPLEVWRYEKDLAETPRETPTS